VSSTDRAGRWAGRFSVLLVGLLVGGTAAPVAAQAGLIVRKLSFDGNKAFDDAALASAIQTTTSSWFATTPVIRVVGLGEKRRLNERDLERDVERLRLFYRIGGFLEVQVDTLIRRTDRDAYITFKITEGAPVRVGRLDIAGLDSVAEREKLLRDLPLQVGDPFNRDRLGIAADTIAGRLRDRGYATATVFLAGRRVDSAAYRAEVDLEVVTGPQMVIGDIRIIGDDIAAGFAGRLLSTGTGRMFRQSDVLRSQRNIASSDLYRFASVDVDTARFVAGSDSVPLLVSVVPGFKHKASTGGGYGTDDCFRMQAGYTIRNPLRAGWILDFSGRLTKIGVGEPLDWGLEENFLCSRLKNDPIGSSKLNYTASVALRQPAFIRPENSAQLQFFAERRSEFAVYAREEIGGNFSVVRETARRIPITVGYRLSYGFTTANDVNFCAYFNACNPADIAALQERQRQGVISAGVSSLRLNNLLDPTRGTSVGLQLSYSAQWTLSEEFQQFTRLVGDASWYHPIGGGVVLALHGRAGLLHLPRITVGDETTQYVTPDQRFYAGGANDVRGYDRNELGPIVYVVLDTAAVPGPDGRYPDDEVTLSPVGGDRSLVFNAELRLPSPIWTSRMRFAAFVDAGSVWGTSDAINTPVQFRFTPGAGVRFATPLGPARLDVAYNGYANVPGPLYASRPDGSLELVDQSYVKSRSRGVTLHFAIGQAF
jgi:outer membrane protein insertion porin family